MGVISLSAMTERIQSMDWLGYEI